MNEDWKNHIPSRQHHNLSLGVVRDLKHALHRYHVKLNVFLGHKPKNEMNLIVNCSIRWQNKTYLYGIAAVHNISFEFLAY